MFRFNWTTPSGVTQNGSFGKASENLGEAALNVLVQEVVIDFAAWNGAETLPPSLDLGL